MSEKMSREEAFEVLGRSVVRTVEDARSALAAAGPKAVKAFEQFARAMAPKR